MGENANNLELSKLDTSRADQAAGEGASCWYDGQSYPHGTTGVDDKTGATYECKNGEWVKISEG